jgi:prophage regulatory protein
MSGDHKPGDGTAAAPLRMERMADLEGRVGLKKSQLWTLIREGRFPRPVKVGRATLFVSSEIDAWMAERIRESREGKR